MGRDVEDELWGGTSTSYGDGTWTSYGEGRGRAMGRDVNGLRGWTSTGCGEGRQRVPFPRTTPSQHSHHVVCPTTVRGGPEIYHQSGTKNQKSRAQSQIHGKRERQCDTRVEAGRFFPRVPQFLRNAGEMNMDDFGLAVSMVSWQRWRIMWS